MTTAVRAIFEDGVFKPEENVPLKDKTRVQLVISPDSEPVHDDVTRPELRRIRGLTFEHQGFFIEKWNEYFGHQQ